MGMKMLITFEGGDGAGKSTLIDKVSAYLYEIGRQVLSIREPGGSPLGNELRNIILKPNPNIKIGAKAELLLYMASRAQIVEEIIEPAIHSGKIVLCDRFNDSTLAYQGGARGLNMEALKYICHFVCGKVQPQVTFYLDIDPVIGLERTRKLCKAESNAGEMDRIEAEAVSFHHRVRNTYLEIAREDPERVIILDASQTLEVVWQNTLKVLQCLNL